jgi:membrane protease YdiL (CAAX protease family)
MKKKEILITGLFIAVLLIVYKFFPTDSLFQNIVVSIFFLAILPLVYNFFVLKKPLGFFGIKKGLSSQGFLWAFISLVFASLIFYIMLSYTEVASHYIAQKVFSQNFWKFLYYEFVYVAPFVLLYEFFFRGFLMLYFGKSFGYFSIIIQFFGFILFLAITGSLGWEFAPYLFFSLFSGIIAYKSKSIYYGVLAHIVFMIIFDASIIKVLQ